MKLSIQVVNYSGGEEITFGVYRDGKMVLLSTHESKRLEQRLLYLIIKENWEWFSQHYRALYSDFWDISFKGLSRKVDEGNESECGYFFTSSHEMQIGPFECEISITCC